MSRNIPNANTHIPFSWLRMLYFRITILIQNFAIQVKASYLSDSDTFIQMGYFESSKRRLQMNVISKDMRTLTMKQGTNF